MIIGIDAHNIEGQRTGVGRYLASLLYQWDNFDLSSDLRFVLYFKKEIPSDLKLTNPAFERKILKSPIQSNAFFVHWLLPKAAKKDKIDILFSPSYIAPVFYRRGIALSPHDIIYQARPELYNWRFLDKILLKKVSQIAIKRAKTIFTPSQFTKEEIVRHFQINPKKIIVAPLAVDNSFKPIRGQSVLKKIKEKYQIKDKFILYIGSIFNRRHLDKIIEGFEKTANQRPNYQLLIIGKNHTNPFIDIEKIIKEANQRLKKEAILMKDYVKGGDIAPIYSAADLLIWLSDYEGFGFPILEAMACGTPVITSQKASIPEVANNAAMYIENSSNTEEIAQVIKKILTNKRLRDNLTKKGLLQARKFSWTKCAKTTLDALLGD